VPKATATTTATTTTTTSKQDAKAWTDAAGSFGPISMAISQFPSSRDDNVKIAIVASSQKKNTGLLIYFFIFSAFFFLSVCV